MTRAWQLHEAACVGSTGDVVWGTKRNGGEEVRGPICTGEEGPRPQPLLQEVMALGSKERHQCARAAGLARMGQLRTRRLRATTAMGLVVAVRLTLALLRPAYMIKDALGGDSALSP